MWPDDFDRDGRIDLATGNQDASSATLLWNDTTFDKAAFSFSRLSYGTPGSTIGGSSAVPADFNEDGKLDVVIKPDYTVGRIVQVFLTDGPIVSLNFPEFAGGYGVADFNKDGHADVMLGNGDTNRLQLWIYLGDGRGNFARAPETRIDTSVLGLGLGDLNGDSAPDLVLISYDRAISSNYLQLLLNRGDGTFTLGSRVNTTSDYNAAPTVADVNRDGKMDVALFIGGMLTVYRGDGAGNLGPAAAWQIAPYVLQQLALADLNHDGLLDAVAGEQGRVRIALGTRRDSHRRR